MKEWINTNAQLNALQRIKEEEYYNLYKNLIEEEKEREKQQKNNELRIKEITKNNKYKEQIIEVRKQREHNKMINYIKIWWIICIITFILSLIWIILYEKLFNKFNKHIKTNETKNRNWNRIN